MSRENLSDFVYAAEHSFALRKKLKDCKDKRALIELAREYGFCITNNDLVDETKYSKLEQWFEDSQINPIKTSEGFCK